MSIGEDYINLLNFKKNDMSLCTLKEHMEKYPSNYITKDINNWIINNIKNELQKNELKDSFNMSDELPYTKKIEILKNFPFLNIKDFKNIFYALTDEEPKYDGDPKNLYLACKNYCDKRNISIDEDLFKKIINFCEENELIVKSEFNSNKKIKINNGNTKGIIGEHYIYCLLKQYDGKVTYIKNNAFGFDILYVDSSNKEWLVEVKTTEKKLKASNSLTFTEHELEILNKTLSLPNTEYIIEKVFYNDNNKSCEHVTMYYDKKNNTFYSIDNNTTYIHYQKNPLKYVLKQ